jgi:hypothetical protein
VGSVLLPIYLGYLWPWLRMRVFGAAIAPEVWRRKHVAGRRPSTASPSG